MSQTISVWKTIISTMILAYAPTMILLVIILTPTPTTWIWIISHLEVLDHSGPRTPIKGYMQAHPQMTRLLPKPITWI